VIGPKRDLSHRGFTLIEASLAMVIVGIGIVSAVRLFAACTQENRGSVGMTTATLLANHVREAMNGLSFDDPGTATTTFGPEGGETLATYDDLDDFNAQTFNPPIDAMRQPIASQSQYTQVVRVVPVFPNKLSSNIDDSAPEIAQGTYTGAVRIRVIVLYRATASEPNTEVYRASWIRMDD
jgi:prepilin-type N-terminal cleavage/methylation domain-containing protein